MFAFLAALALPLVSAAPLTTLTSRATVPWCDGLGSTATDTPASNFTLAALYTTLPNANTTGVPLVLGQDGAITGASFEVLSVRLVLLP